MSNDRPLLTWILGFGGMARVASPKSLARDILDEVQAARQVHAEAEIRAAEDDGV